MLLTISTGRVSRLVVEGRDDGVVVVVVVLGAVVDSDSDSDVVVAWLE
jgi:hypothetical protein